ncbi:MAG: hemolysin family protein, partial [Bacteroidota bacterium]|nr:hemolysin family protein [Bacteroidota bacterium]
VLTLAIGSLYVVSATLAARAIGSHRAEQVAMRTASVLAFLVRCTAPFVRFFTWTADAVIGKPAARARFGDVVMSEEELRELIEEGTKAGFVDKTEQELIESIFRFTDKTAREIMIPRKEVAAIDYSTPPEAILERVVEEGYTRMPVYKGTLDTIVGVINSKDVLSLIEHKNLIILDDIIRPAFFVPDTKPISELLRDFQRRRIHLAVVVDEFGGTEGIITLEDILEEIVGDIHDEYDEDAMPYAILPGGIVEVEGRMTISDFNAMFPFAIPESDEYDTVGGFITKLMGRIPERGDVVERHDAHIEVVEVDGRRIVRARFSPRGEDNPGPHGDAG